MEFSAQRLSEELLAVPALSTIKRPSCIPAQKRLSSVTALTRLYLEAAVLTHLYLATAALTRLYLATAALTHLYLATAALTRLYLAAPAQSASALPPARELGIGLAKGRTGKRKCEALEPVLKPKKMEFC